MSNWDAMYYEETAQVREPTYRDEEELIASAKEIDEMIEEFGFRLDEEDPENGGFLCDYFPSLEDEPNLQQRILYNQYRIYQTLLREYHTEKERLEKIGVSEAEKKFWIRNLYRTRSSRREDDSSTHLRIIK